MEENNKEVVERKQKKSKTALVAIITLIAGLALGVGGSYYYFEVMSDDKTNVKTEEKNTKNKDTEENKTVKYENLDVLSDIVQNNFNKFMRSASLNCGVQKEYFKATKVTSSNIDNTLAYSTVSTYFFDNKGNISADEFDKVVKMYFGKDYKYQHQDQKICTNHHYNATTNTYEYIEPVCGGICGPHNIEYKITKAELVDDKMILNIKVLFPGNDTDRDSNGYVKYYSDVNLTKPVSDLYYISGYGDKDAPITESDYNLAKGGNYKFVMQKYDDNNYSFVSSEPIA